MTIESIIQGGAVGLCAFSLFIIWKLAGNHINHNTQILTELKDAICDLKQVIKDKL